VSFPAGTVLPDVDTGILSSQRLKLMAGFTFRDTERLKKKKLIDQLFANGMSFYSHPFKIIWLITETGQPSAAQVLISVSRRVMKRAVDRNRVKRQVRELYRHQKSMIYEYLAEKQRSALIGIIYTGSELLPFPVAKEKINQVMVRLLKEFRKQIER
jgi:ribonuclease P protein component